MINYYISFYKVCYTPFSDCSFQPITLESRVRGTSMAHAYDSTQAKPCQWILGLLPHTGYDEVVGLCILLVRRKCHIVLLLSWYSLQFSNSSVIVNWKERRNFVSFFTKEVALLVFCVFFPYFINPFKGRFKRIFLLLLLINFYCTTCALWGV